MTVTSTLHTRQEADSKRAFEHEHLSSFLINTHRMVRVHAAQRQSRSSPRLIEDKQGQEEGRGPTLCHRQIATGQLETVFEPCLRLAWVQRLV